MQRACAHCGKIFMLSLRQQKKTRVVKAPQNFCCSRTCRAMRAVRARNHTTHLSLEKLARCQLNMAVRLGRVKRPARCASCHKMPGTDRLGRSRIQAHHPDHNKPLAVVWLCRACHQKETIRPKGEDSAVAKLTNKKVKAIRREFAAGKSGPVIAKAFRISKKTVYDIMHGRTWGHLPCC